MTHEPLYEYRGADFLAQCLAVVSPLLGAGLIAPGLYGWLGWGGSFGMVTALLVLALGLSGEITVTIDETTVVKRWFGLPYRRYSAPYISLVEYGGDWGLPDGAVGVVVQIGERRVHIGAPWSMRRIHDALTPSAA